MIHVTYLPIFFMVASLAQGQSYWDMITQWNNHDNGWNKMNPGYFSLAATALKLQQITMFLHISARVWGHRWSPHTSQQKGYMLKPQ